MAGCRGCTHFATDAAGTGFVQYLVSQVREGPVEELIHPHRPQARGPGRVDETIGRRLLTSSWLFKKTAFAQLLKATARQVRISTMMASQ